eukprot:COSAG02_NODE_575_length_20117_cov_5.801139_7_plen_86_part_00
MPVIVACQRANFGQPWVGGPSAHTQPQQAMDWGDLARKLAGCKDTNGEDVPTAVGTFLRGLTGDEDFATVASQLLTTIPNAGVMS